MHSSIIKNKQTSSKKRGSWGGEREKQRWGETEETERQRDRETGNIDKSIKHYINTNIGSSNHLTEELTNQSIPFLYVAKKFEILKSSKVSN